MCLKAENHTVWSITLKCEPACTMTFLYSFSAVKLSLYTPERLCGICGPQMTPEAISEHNIVIHYVVPFQGVQAPNPPYSSCVLMHQCTRLKSPFASIISSVQPMMAIFNKPTAGIHVLPICQLACHAHMATIWGQYAFSCMTTIQNNEEYVWSTKQLNCS